MAWLFKGQPISPLHQVNFLFHESSTFISNLQLNILNIFNLQLNILNIFNLQLNILNISSMQLNILNISNLQLNDAGPGITGNLPASPMPWQSKVVNVILMKQSKVVKIKQIQVVNDVLVKQSKVVKISSTSFFQPLRI